MKQLLLVFALLAFAVTASASQQSGRFTWDFDLSTHNPGLETKLWIPYPVSDSQQIISDIKWNGTYSQAAVYTERTFGVPMLYVYWPKEAQKRKITFSFSAERVEHVKRDFPEEEAVYDPRDYKLYLSSTKLGPITGEVKKLADQITAKPVQSMTGRLKIPIATRKHVAVAWEMLRRFFAARVANVLTSVLFMWLSHVLPEFPLERSWAYVPARKRARTSASGNIAGQNFICPVTAGFL